MYRNKLQCNWRQRRKNDFIYTTMWRCCWWWQWVSYQQLSAIYLEPNKTLCNSYTISGWLSSKKRGKNIHYLFSKLSVQHFFSWFDICPPFAQYFCDRTILQMWVTISHHRSMSFAEYQKGIHRPTGVMGRFFLISICFARHSSFCVLRKTKMMYVIWNKY